MTTDHIDTLRAIARAANTAAIAAAESGADRDTLRALDAAADEAMDAYTAARREYYSTAA